MNFLEISLLSLSLAMDCFAVAIAGSVSYGKYDLSKILRMTFFFGLFQGVMPVIGYFVSIIFSDFIFTYNHWVSLIILAYIGIKMIVESIQDRKKSDKECDNKMSPYGSLRILLLLAIATSIDALATGLIFVNQQGIILWAALIIGLGSFIFTFLGCIIGLKVGQKLNFNFELLGGIILIMLGVKIFIEHYI